MPRPSSLCTMKEMQVSKILQHHKSDKETLKLFSSDVEWYVITFHSPSEEKACEVKLFVLTCWPTLPPFPNHINVI